MDEAFRRAVPKAVEGRVPALSDLPRNRFEGPQTLAMRHLGDVPELGTEPTPSLKETQ